MEVEDPKAAASRSRSSRGLEVRNGRRREAPSHRIGVVRGVRKLPIVAVAGALLAAGVSACGGGSNSTEATSQGQATGKSSANVKKGKNEGSSGKSGSSGGGGSGKSASEFVPRHHHDSGGGSKQFQVKGGDNSVQEFGKEAVNSELDEAAAALHNFLDARAQGNWAAACQYMSKAVTESFAKLGAGSKQIKNTSCPAVLAKLINPAAKQLMKEEAAKANVGSLRVEGGRSFIIYTGTQKTILAMPMAHEGGAWKVASLAGTPLN